MRAHAHAQRRPGVSNPAGTRVTRVVSYLAWVLETEQHSLTTEPSHKHNFYEHLNQVAAVFTSMTNNWETQPQFFIKENDLFFPIQSLLKTAFPIPRSTWT